MRLPGSLLMRRKKPNRRRLQLEHLEGRYVLNGQAVLLNDAFSLHENGPQVSLDVLANDTFDPDYAGNRLITSVSFGSEGGRIEIAGDQRSVLYTPPADYFGTETFVYAVDGAHTATVSVSVQSPLAFDHYFIPPDGGEHQLDVLANDPFWSGYTGARQITSVSVGSEGGTIEIADDGESIRYTPPDGAFGKETFIYVVDELYPAQVTIEIPETLKGDEYEFVKYEPASATLHVLANDPFWAGYSGARQITHITASQVGATIDISADGKSLVYNQPTDFGERDYSYRVYDSFRYVVDGEYEAHVSVVLNRPVQDDWFEVDRNSTSFYFNVIANDTYRDTDNRLHDVIDRVTSVTQSEQGGTVAIAADGQGVLYTPPADFTGTDTFTYEADGLHEARVTVQVTRPVRDDYFGNVIYQDTPGGVLNVLGNDFLGNGYAGPRLITSVGTTQNGGTVAIHSDGKALLYTPAPGYTGSDSFTYAVDGNLEANVTVFVTPLAQSDHAQFYPDAPHPYSLNVLANDHFHRGYSGPAVITAVELVSGSGDVSIGNGRTVLFDPSAAGSHVIRYTVDGKYESTVSVWIQNVVGDYFVVNQNSASQQFNVLANDFYLNYPLYSYPGPRIITGVTQSVNGGIVTIAVDGKSVHYEAPEDYYGTDSFTYTVDGFMTATVSVEVIRRVRDDQFRVDAADGPQKLPVLVNDLFGANYSGPGHITGVTATSGGGSATIGSDGRSIVYTPAAGFVGTDTFTYTVDGALKAEVKVVVDAPAGEQSPTFGSVEDYTQFLLDDALERYQWLFGQPVWDIYPPVFAGPGGLEDAGGRSHSETNVQVAGVDEGDIVEFDSDYVYMLTDSEVVIVDAWPAEELSVESRVEIEGRTIAQFLHGDRLTVISELGGGFQLPPWDVFGAPVADRIGGPFWWEPLPSFTIVTVIDVSDRAAPTIVQTTSMEGKYVDSRGVGDYVYVLVSNPNAVAPQPEIIDEDNDPTTLNRYETEEEYIARVTANSGIFVEAALPNYTSYGADGEMVRTGLLNAPEDIYQPIVPDSFNLISVVSFNVESNEPGLSDTSAVYSTGASAIYASLDNFYVFDSDYTREDGAVTRIVKFDWDPETGGVDFAASTAVAGRILNQFSADENGPYLRIATTISNQNSGNWSGRDENLLFVLQEDEGVMEFVGSLQNLALNETMRSVRFLGDRAFVTTFRDVDPLFAIDLTDAANPKSVGHITLPGFTSYMHLVGENHLLTVGRNTPVGHSGPTQVSLFDISNLAQPLRIAEYTFERFSTSEAELDHHAFGYYTEHGLLGMPVARVFIERVDEDGDGYRETRRSVRRDDLAVFSIDVSADPEHRLVLETEIEHGTPVRRSGYIGDKLYSIANDSVKVVDVADLDTLIAELIVVSPSEEEDDGEVPPLARFDSANFGTITAEMTTDYPATRADTALLTSVDQARLDLAARLNQEAGAAMFVTAEAARGAPGRGYNLVFRVSDQHFLYRAGMDGAVVLVNSDFDFSDSAAWHAADIEFVAPPTTIAGDYNDDGRVDLADRSVWQSSFGASSLTTFLPADGNRGGTVNAADFIVWRNNLGSVANNSGDAGAGGYAVWQSTFASETDMRADVNHDQAVDAADYVGWRKSLGISTAAYAVAAEAGGSAESVPAFAFALDLQLKPSDSSPEAAAVFDSASLRSSFERPSIGDGLARHVAVERYEAELLALLALDAPADERTQSTVGDELAISRVVNDFDAVDEAIEAIASLRLHRTCAVPLN